MNAREHKKTTKLSTFTTNIESFKCPITLEYFKEPVMAMDGHTYEKKAILTWFENHNTSPLTNEELSSKLIIYNWALKQAMDEAFEIIDKKKIELANLKKKLSPPAPSASCWEVMSFFRHIFLRQEENKTNKPNHSRWC